MDRIRATFTQKLGPLPVWGWAALALAALLGYWYFTKSGPFGGSSSTAAGSGPTAQPPDPLGQLLGNMNNPLTSDVAATASTGLAGGGGSGIFSQSQPVFGPSITSSFAGIGSGNQGSSAAPSPNGVASAPTFAATTQVASYSPYQQSFVASQAPVVTRPLNLISSLVAKTGTYLGPPPPRRTGAQAF